MKLLRVAMDDPDHGGTPRSETSVADHNMLPVVQEIPGVRKEFDIKENATCSRMLLKHEGADARRYGLGLQLEIKCKPRFDAEGEWDQCPFDGNTTYCSGERSAMRLSLVVMLLLLPGHVNAQCITPDCAPAEGWDNFANNLGSDMAPLLALLGEQVTKQYMSESLDWVDNLLFALAPLGIITAMVAAIRVAGSSSLKSIIGRAKETYGDVEADLMSSTSTDVCELWSGEGVVRVIGNPDLLQLVWVPGNIENKDKSCGLYNFRETKSRNQYYRRQRTASQYPLTVGRVWRYVRGDKPGDPESKDEGTPDEGRRTENGQISPERIRKQNVLIDQNPPNVSLNLSVKPLPREILFIFVFIGIILQLGVLAFAAVSKYTLRLPKNNSTVPDYAFPVLVVGTLGLALGVFLCAHAVESSTSELSWEARSENTYVLWLQQGGQKVGDQMFGAFAQRSEGRILTSYREKEHIGGRRALVFVAVAVTLLGFIAQFFALRAAHSSVTVMQLCAILFVTILRSFAHLQRHKKNEIKAPLQVEGFELDWLAKHLGNIDHWEVVIGVSSADPGARATSQPAPPAAPQNAPMLPQAVRVSTEAPAPPNNQQDNNRGTSQAHNNEAGPSNTYTPPQVLEARARLAQLSDKWNLDLRESVKVLQNAIEMTMSDVFSKMTPKDKASGESDAAFNWTVPVKVRFGGEDNVPYLLDLSLTRQRDEFAGWSDWKVDKYRLEAVLGLWVSSLAEADRRREETGETNLKNIWLLGPATDAFKREHSIWILRTAPHSTVKLLAKDIRHFGWIPKGEGSNGLENDNFLFVDTNLTLERACTQQLYLIFLSSLASTFQTVGGETTTRLEETTVAENPVATAGLADFRLKNTNLASIATIFKDCKLGTIEEAYCCIIPAFHKVPKPPPPRRDFEDAQEMSSKLAAKGDWRRSMDIDIYVKRVLGLADLLPHETQAVEGQLYSRLHQLTTRLTSDTASATESESLQHLGPMWTALNSRCKLMSPNKPPPRIGLDLMVLCLTQQRIKEDNDLEELHELISNTIQALDPDASRKDIRNEIKSVTRSSYIMKTPERFSRFVWAKTMKPLHTPPGESIYSADFSQPSNASVQAIVPTDSVVSSSRESLDSIRNNPPSELGSFITSLPYGDSSASSSQATLPSFGSSSSPGELIGTLYHNPASKVLIEARRLTKHMFTSTSFQKYIESESAKFMSKTSAMKGVTRAEIDDYTIPIDLLLIRGYRTPLQMAAELGNEYVVNRILSFRRLDDQLDLPAPRGGRTALQAAAGGGHMSIVKSLLRAGASKDAPAATYSGRTALQAAAEGQHDEVLRYLVSEGANVNADPASMLGVTALEAAAKCGNIKIVKFLLEKGATVNTTPFACGRTPLQGAAEGGHDEVIKLLLHVKVTTQLGGDRSIKFSHTKADINAPPAERGGRSALQVAVEQGHLDSVQLLLDNGAHVNGPPAKEYGCIALKTAAGAGRKDIVELLLRADADKDAEAVNIHGLSALYVAVESGHHGIVKMLLDSGTQIQPDWAEPTTDKTILQATMENGKAEIVKLILTAQFDLEAALHHALSNSHVDVYDDLLKRDQVDVNRIYSGIPALISAAERNHPEVISWLTKRHRLDFNILDSSRSTALAVAAKAGFIEIVGLLLGHRRTLADLADQDGRTPLISAASAAKLDVVRILLEDKRVNPRLLTKKGSSCLLEAVVAECDKVVETILGYPFSEELKNYADHEGTTPLIMAATKGLDSITGLLLDKQGVDINHADNKGQTAFYLASRNRHEDIVLRLLQDKRVDLQTCISVNDSILLLAIERQKLPVVSRLLKTDGIESLLNKPGNDGRFPILCAASGGDIEIMKQLLRMEGIRIDVKDSQGHTPLLVAIRERKLDIVKKLLSRKAVEINEEVVLSIQTSLEITKALQDHIRSARVDHTSLVRLKLEENPRSGMNLKKASNSQPASTTEPEPNATAASDAGTPPNGRTPSSTSSALSSEPVPISEPVPMAEPGLTSESGLTSEPGSTSEPGLASQPAPIAEIIPIAEPTRAAEREPHAQIVSEAKSEPKTKEASRIRLSFKSALGLQSGFNGGRKTNKKPNLSPGQTIAPSSSSDVRKWTINTFRRPMPVLPSGASSGITNSVSSAGQVHNAETVIAAAGDRHGESVSGPNIGDDTANLTLIADPGLILGAGVTINQNTNRQENTVTVKTPGVVPQPNVAPKVMTDLGPSGTPALTANLGSTTDTPHIKENQIDETSSTKSEPNPLSDPAANGGMEPVLVPDLDMVIDLSSSVEPGSGVDTPVIPITPEIKIDRTPSNDPSRSCIHAPTPGQASSQTGSKGNHSSTW